MSQERSPDPLALDMQGRTAANVLDDFHDAASRADFARYFGHFTDDARFLGTDASERWTRDQFAAYTRPYFQQGRGWTYVPRDRHIALNDRGDIAWFDEVLENEKYGLCRGTGVLVRTRAGWRISQYSLTFLIPNEIASDVTAKAKGLQPPQ